MFAKFVIYVVGYYGRYVEPNKGDDALYFFMI